MTGIMSATGIIGVGVMNSINSVGSALAHLGTMLASLAGVLAYRPFLDPAPFDGYWLFIPLVIAVAVVYKTIKLEDLRRLPREAGILATQITVFMLLAAAAIWLLVELV